MPVHLKNVRKYKSRRTVAVSMEIEHRLAIESIAASRGVKMSDLVRGWVLDRLTEIELEQE